MSEPGPPSTQAGGRAYDQLLRGPGYRWWQPALGLAVATTVYLALLVLFRVVAASQDIIRTDELDPLLLAILNLSVAAVIPAIALAMLVVHRRRFGQLSSIAGHIRWRYLAKATWLAVLVAVAFTFVAPLLPVNGEIAESPPTVSFETWLGFAAVVVLTTPLQAAGEEYLFRGYAMQALSAWFRAPWVPMLVTSAAFAFAHGTQDGWLFFDRFLLGLVACWLVVRTGGLEAAIALHVVNNMLVFLLAAAFDQVGDELTVTSLPWQLAVLHALQMVAFAWLAIRAFDKHGFNRFTAEPSSDHARQT